MTLSLEKGKFLFDLDQLQRACSSYWQRKQVSWDTIDTCTVGFWNPTDPRNTDRRPTHESLRKNVRFQEKLTCSKERGRVWFAFWSNVIWTIPGSTIWSAENDYEFRGPVGHPSGQKDVGGRRRHTHTADKVLTHGQTLLFYRYRFLHY